MDCYVAYRTINLKAVNNHEKENNASLYVHTFIHKL